MTTVTIDNVEYQTESFTDKQKSLLENVIDLEQKLKKTNMDLLQLQVCLNVFLNELKQELKKS